VAFAVNLKCGYFLTQRNREGTKYGEILLFSNKCFQLGDPRAFFVAFAVNLKYEYGYFLTQRYRENAK
jgi:hypothetical protein